MSAVEQNLVNTIINGDCLEVMKSFPDNSIDAIITDPPYFNFKNDWWDKQWDKPEGYLSWLDALSEQWQRILKPNGSLYCFASPRMAARVEVKLGERFNIVNRITWNKGDLPTGGRHTSTCKEDLRSFFPASEAIIFCEHYGADNIAKGEAGYVAKCDELRGFVFAPLRNYLATEWENLGISRAAVNNILGSTPGGGGMASHYFSRITSQWELPTVEHYTKLQRAFPGYFTREYEELRKEYEELRKEYEELRRPFNVTSDVPYTDVWSFPTVASYPGKHPCEKPSALLEHIISASTKPGALILDCFAGSGSTLAAAKKLKRDFIGIEIDPHWVAVANCRVGNFSVYQPTIEERNAWLETKEQRQNSKVKTADSGQLSLW